MKRVNFIILSGFLAILLVNCEKSEVEDIKEPNQAEATNKADDNRIELLKSGEINTDNYKNQQPFTLHCANQLTKTDFGFVVEYRTGEDFKLHEFDFIWNEKLVEDGNDKIWMNLDIYHKTIEENAKQTMRDSTLISASFPFFGLLNNRFLSFQRQIRKAFSV